MKTSIFSIALLFCVIVITSCSETIIGPEGPRGPEGPKGNDGLNGAAGENAFVFEFEDINFTAGNDYKVLLKYPNGFDGLTSDVALVYFLWNVEDGVEIWRMLPQTVFFDGGGLLQYNFDFTAGDVSVFLKANFPLGQLGAIDTDNWIARVVVVPGNFFNGSRIDFSDYNEVKELLGLPEIVKERIDYPIRSN
jgi:hypothetical protein